MEIYMKFPLIFFYFVIGFMVFKHVVKNLEEGIIKGF